MAAPIDLAGSHSENEVCDFLHKEGFCTQLCIKPTGILVVYLYSKEQKNSRPLIGSDACGYDIIRQRVNQQPSFQSPDLLKYKQRKN